MTPATCSRSDVPGQCTPTPKGTTSRLDVEQAVRLYQAGHTMSEVGALLGMSSSQVSKKLRQAGRARSALIKTLREQDRLSWNVVAQHVGMSATAACQDYLAHRSPPATASRAR